VLDGAAICRQQAAQCECQEETPDQRRLRVQSLAELVKAGSYAVRAHQLASALLEWDPKRSSPQHAFETADRRRAYMRAYMRKRRAQLPS
jgi:hypothetical protein